MSFVYGLVDPRTDRIRYVGRAENLTKRYRDHHTPSKLRTHTHKNHWIKSLQSEGLKARLVVLEETDEAVAAERWWIHHLTREGCDLTNLTVGGDGPHRGYRRDFVLSQESRQKISASLRGRQQDPSVVARRTASNTGQTRDSSFVAQMSGVNSVRAQFSQQQVDLIRARVASGVTRVDVARETGVTPTTIGRIVAGRTYATSDR